MLIFKVLFLLSLVIVTAATPTPGIKWPWSKNHMIIGYRDVSERRAKAYNKAGTLEYSTAVQGKENHQLGQGVYLTPAKGQWDGDTWHCVIYALRSAYEALAKIWIPQFDQCGNPLWFKGDQIIDDYIESMGFDPKHTARYSPVKSRGSEVDQISLTPSMMNQAGGGLDIKVKCYAKLRKLPSKAVDLKTLNIKGYPDDDER